MLGNSRGLLDNIATMNHNDSASAQLSSNIARTPSLPTLPFHRQQAAVTDHLQPKKSETGILSEHGHSLDKIEPMSKHSGSSVVTFFNGLFQTILAISTLGASITFSYVLSNNNDQLSAPFAQPYFSVHEVQLFLAISWLLFLLALAFASTGSTLLTFFKSHWIEDWDGLHGKRSQLSVQLYAVAASTIMGGLTIGAFALLCLVVVAYSPVVGWIAISFTGFFGLIIMMAILNQVPWPWQVNTPQPMRQHTI
jgi:hypothetical protein